LEERGTKKNRIFQNKIRFLSLVSVMLRSKKKKSAFSFFFLPLSAKKTTLQQSFFVFFENVLLKDKLEKEVFFPLCIILSSLRFLFQAKESNAFRQEEKSKVFFCFFEGEACLVRLFFS